MTDPAATAADAAAVTLASTSLDGAPVRQAERERQRDRDAPGRARWPIDTLAPPPSLSYPPLSPPHHQATTPTAAEGAPSKSAAKANARAEAKEAKRVS